MKATLQAASKINRNAYRIVLLYYKRLEKNEKFNDFINKQLNMFTYLPDKAQLIKAICKELKWNCSELNDHANMIRDEVDEIKEMYIYLKDINEDAYNFCVLVHSYLIDMSYNYTFKSEMPIEEEAHRTTTNTLRGPLIEYKPSNVYEKLDSSSSFSEVSYKFPTSLERIYHQNRKDDAPVDVPKSEKNLVKHLHYDEQELQIVQLFLNCPYKKDDDYKCTEIEQQIISASSKFFMTVIEAHQPIKQYNEKLFAYLVWLEYTHLVYILREITCIRPRQPLLLSLRSYPQWNEVEAFIRTCKFNEPLQPGKYKVLDWCDFGIVYIVAEETKEHMKQAVINAGREKIMTRVREGLVEWNFSMSDSTGGGVLPSINRLKKAFDIIYTDMKDQGQVTKEILESLELIAKSIEKTNAPTPPIALCLTTISKILTECDDNKDVWGRRYATHPYKIEKILQYVTGSAAIDTVKQEYLNQYCCEHCERHVKWV